MIYNFKYFGKFGISYNCDIYNKIRNYTDIGFNGKYNFYLKNKIFDNRNRNDKHIKFLNNLIKDNIFLEQKTALESSHLLKILVEDLKKELECNYLSPNAKDYFLTNNIFLNLQLIWQRRIYKIDNDIITPIKDMIDRQLYGDEHEVFSIKNVGNFWEYSLPSLPSLLSNNDQGTEFDEYIISNDVKIYNLDQNEIEMNEYDPETNKYKKNDFVLDSF